MPHEEHRRRTDVRAVLSDAPRSRAQDEDGEAGILIKAAEGGLYVGAAFRRPRATPSPHSNRYAVSPDASAISPDGPNATPMKPLPDATSCGSPSRSGSR